MKTDCLSFTIMQQHELTEALTCDHHFEQAGFHVRKRPVNPVFSRALAYATLSP